MPGDADQALRVLHVSTPKQWRGGEQQLTYLVSELTAVRHFILTPPDSQLARYSVKQGYCWLPLSLKGLLARVFQLKRVVRKHGIDLVHVHDAKAHTLAYLAALIGMPAPIVVARRVDFPVKTNPLSRRKYLHPSIKRIIAVSNAIADILKAQLPLQDRLTVVHSGVDVEKFENAGPGQSLRQEWDIPADHWLIGNTSAIADHKDYYTFVDVAAYAQQQGLRATFFIIGDGPESPAIAEYIKAKGMGATVFMTGFRDDVPALLPQLDLYLMTSKTEGLGTSVLDAFAAEVPVVATQTGGIPEMVSHAETGLLAPVKDAQALGEALIQLTQEPRLRETLVANALQKLRAFTKSRMASETYAVYQAVLRQTDPSPYR